MVLPHKISPIAARSLPAPVAVVLLRLAFPPNVPSPLPRTPTSQYPTTADRPTDRSTSTVIPSLLMWHTPPIRVGPRLPSSFQTLLWTPSFPDFALLHFLAFQFSPRHRCATVTLSQFAGRAEGLARPALAGLERLASSDKGPSTNKRRNGITCILWVLSTVHCSTFFMAEVATQMALGDIERLLLCTNIFYLACL